MDSIVTNHARC